MGHVAGYLVDMSSVTLDDATSSSWIQAMPYGKYQHPVHGEIDLNAERGTRFAANVKANVRGQDLDIDYDHKEKDGKAAGWVRDAEARGDGVYLKVEWTPPALQAIKNREYRYFSPEFDDQWAHPVTKIVHQDVIFGGALTNRPFLKGILPINLSEVLEHASNPKTDEGGKKVMNDKLKAIAAQLGLGDDADDDKLGDALGGYEFVTEPTTAPSNNDNGGGAPQLSEDDAIKKLTEESPVIKRLVEAMEGQSKALAETQGKLRLAEVTTEVTKLNEKAHKASFAIPPATLEEITTELVKTPATIQLSESPTLKALNTLLDAKLVQLGEKGFGKLTTENGTATVKFFAEVKKLTDGDAKMQYGDAVNEVAKADPQLYADYTVEATTTSV